MEHIGQFVHSIDAFADAYNQVGWDNRERKSTHEIIDADGIVMEEDDYPVTDTIKHRYVHGQIPVDDVFNLGLSADCAVTNAMLAIMCHWLDHVYLWPREFVDCLKRRAVGFYAHDTLTVAMRPLPSLHECVRVVNNAAGMLQTTDHGRLIHSLYLMITHHEQ